MTGKKTFAMRLKEAREVLGVSQKQLGILAGIDQFVASARINQYERGKHVPDPLMAERLARVLNVPRSFLYEPNDDLALLLRLAARLSRARLRAVIQGIGEEQTRVGDRLLTTSRPAQTLTIRKTNPPRG